MSFEWHTEEEERDDRTWPEPEAPASPSPHWRWLLLLLAALLLGIGAYFVRQQLQERVTEVEAAETEAVMSSERLAQQAARTQDKELLKSILSGRDPAWIDVQYRLLAQGVLLQEAGQAVALEPHPAAPTLDITFDPRLWKAEVVAAHAFTATESNGSTTMVRLAQTRIYRRGRERWLLSPPESDFWGAQHSLRKPHLSLSYPERDATLAARLADDFDRMLGELCALPKMGCSDEFLLRVYLDRNGESLLALTDEHAFWQTEGDVDLPAPSLVGLPQDEESYQALLRGYGVPLVEAAVTELVGYRCCDHSLLYQATLDWILKRMELQAWPLGPDGRVAAVDFLERPGQLQALWEIDAVESATPVQRHQAYAAVETLLARATVAEATLQRALLEAPNMASWVRGSGRQESLTTFMHRVRRTLFAQIEAQELPPPLPQQDLLASCREGAAERLYRYDLATASWTRLGEDFSLGISANGNLVRGARFSAASRSFSVWVDGARIEVKPQTQEEDFLPAHLWEWERVDPVRQYLPVHVRGADGRVALALADIKACTEGGCPWQPITTLPLWSPDGANLLWADDGEIWRQPRGSLGKEEPTLVGPGSRPFWLSSAQFGYIRDGELITESVAGDGPRSLLALAPLLEEFSPEEVVDILPAPGGKATLALLLENSARGQSAIVLLQESGSGQPELFPLVTEGARRIFAPPLISFSPDGRWLVVHTSAIVGGERGEFLLYDLSTGEQVVRALAPWWVQPGFQAAQQFAWSADGRWLARVATHQIDLLATVEDGFYRRYVPPPATFPGGTDCEAVGWVDGE